MTRRIVLRRSSRDEILWNFHVVLDSVPEGDAGRPVFASRILQQFGVPWWRRRKLVVLACERLPRDLDTADMSDVMRAFESVIPIEWDNDLKVVGPQATADLERSVLGILEAAAKQLPDEVTALVIRELERTAGSALDRSLLPGVAKAIEGLFVHQLWRANDKASYERLKDSLFFILKSQARLDLTAD